MWWQREPLTAALDVLGNVSARDLGVLVACWALWSTARVVTQWLSLAEARWTHAAVLAEIDLAAHSLPAGGVSAFSARIAVGRSFGHGAPALSVSFLVVSEAVATGLWLLVLVTSLRDIVAGTAGGLEQGAAVAAAGSLLVTLLIVWVVTRRSRFTDALLRAATWVQRRVARRWAAAGRLDLHRFVADAQRDAGRVIRARWAGLLAAGIATVLASGLLLTTAVRSLGIDVDAWALWGGFALATAAIGFSPTPGGVGVAETAMGAMLVAAGAGAPEAIAAVVVHRGFTFVLPTMTGALTFAGWSRQNRWRERPVDRSSGSVAADQ